MRVVIIKILLIFLVPTISFGQSCDNMPPESDFSLEVLEDDAPGNPWDITVADNGMVYWVSRAGQFAVFDPSTSTTTRIHTFDVLWEQNDNRVNFEGAIESGLQGVALDKNFSTNKWIYFWYSPPPSELPNFQKREMGPIERLSRFTLTANGKGLVPNSERIIYQHSINAQCCHYGGDLDLGPDGNLWISTGDNRLYWDKTTKNPFKDDQEFHDVRRTSGNTNDPRGKVLRLSPKAFPDSDPPHTPGRGSTYEIPSGNLWNYYGPNGKGLWAQSQKNKVLPEIFSMGNRNPVSMCIRPEDNWLATGEAAGDDNGYEAGGDEINVLTNPASVGWPFFNMNNMPYHQSNLGTLSQLDPNNVLNLSPHNTGTEKLPPHIGSVVSTKGTGITHNLGCYGVAVEWVQSDPGLNSDVKFPPYLHNKLLFTSSGGGEIFALTLDANGTAINKEKFFSGGNDIISAEMGPDGALYLAVGSSGSFNTFNGSIKKLSYKGDCAPYIVSLNEKKLSQKFIKRKISYVTQGKFWVEPGFKFLEIFDVKGNKIMERDLNNSAREIFEFPNNTSEGIFYIKYSIPK